MLLPFLSFPPFGALPRRIDYGMNGRGALYFSRLSGEYVFGPGPSFVGMPLRGSLPKEHLGLFLTLDETSLLSPGL